MTIQKATKKLIKDIEYQTWGLVNKSNKEVWVDGVLLPAMTDEEKKCTCEKWAVLSNGCKCGGK